MTWAWMGAAMVVMSNGIAVAAPDAIAYALPAVCFESKVSVRQRHDEDDGGYRAELTFAYRHTSTTAAAPTAIGGRLQAQSTYKLCATQIRPEPGVPPSLDLIEIWHGRSLVWSSSYQFPVTQTLAWTKDGRALLVEFGRAMDDVWATPFPRGLGAVTVAAPADVARVAGTGVRTIIVRVDERAAGATLALVAIRDGGAELWRAPVGAP